MVAYVEVHYEDVTKKNQLCATVPFPDSLKQYPQTTLGNMMNQFQWSSDKTSSLVTSGVYRFSRNPMYVGMLLILTAWAVFLAVPLTLLGPLAFFLYLKRFQIEPEERVMGEIFGAEFSAYRAQVRRWL
jgi:protein-S-isoprenylcysteine O-methyltransferase Ste14